MSNLDWWKTWTPELAYVLGFAFADGGIGRGRNSLVLYQSQRALLDKLYILIPGGHIGYSQGSKVWRLRFCEPGLSDILAEVGIVPNKTELGFYPDIPLNLIRHYLRGFFDGDGHVSIRKKRKRVILVCHLESYLEDVKMEFRTLGVEHGILAADGKNFRLYYRRSLDLVKIHELFYRDTALFCERKKSSFDEVIHYITHSQGCKGSSHGNAKLTEDSVIKIRELWRTGQYTQIELGNMFSVNNRNISMIVNNIAWRHVP